MGRVRQLAAIVVVLGIVLGGLIYFYSAINGSIQPKEETKGLTHVRSIYGWGSRPDQMLTKPHSVAADSKGNLYVTLPTAGRVAVFDSQGRFVRAFGAKGKNPGSLHSPLGISIDESKKRVYVADRARFRLVIFDLEGKFVSETALLSPITPMASGGKVYLSTFGPIVLFSPDGKKLDQWGARGRKQGEFDFAHGLARDSKGNLYVADTNNGRLVSLDKNGKVRWTIGQPVSSIRDDEKRQLHMPAGLAIDEKDRLYLVDAFDYNIKVFDTEGKKLGEFGTSGQFDGQLNLPDGIAYMGNRLFAVADKYNNRVQILRLVLPGEERLADVIPWWLPMIALLLLVPLFGRKHAIADESFLARAAADGNLRIAAAVYKRISVTPETFKKFERTKEEGLSLRDVLSVRKYSEKKAKEIKDARGFGWNLASFTASTKRRLSERLFLHRIEALIGDDEAARSVVAEGVKVTAYEDFVDRYGVVEAATG